MDLCSRSRQLARTNLSESGKEGDESCITAESSVIDRVPVFLVPVIGPASPLTPAAALPRHDELGRVDHLLDLGALLIPEHPNREVHDSLTAQTEPQVRVVGQHD